MKEIEVRLRWCRNAGDKKRRCCAFPQDSGRPVGVTVVMCLENSVGTLSPSSSGFVFGVRDAGEAG